MYYCFVFSMAPSYLYGFVRLATCISSCLLFFDLVHSLLFLLD